MCIEIYRKYTRRRSERNSPMPSALCYEFKTFLDDDDVGTEKENERLFFSHR